MLEPLLHQWSSENAPAPSGMAAVYYRAGNQPPVQVLTKVFRSTTEPQSLNLLMYDPDAQPVTFLMFIGVEAIYIGPGEYKGNVDDIKAGIGIVSNGEGALTWTAGENTATDLMTYFVPHQPQALLGSCTMKALVPGPVFGSPDDPLPSGQPALDILFCFFDGGASS